MVELVYLLSQVLKFFWQVLVASDLIGFGFYFENLAISRLITVFDQSRFLISTSIVRAFKSVFGTLF
jgi:hypothetical protein